MAVATARAMQGRGPHARCVEFAGVGHAPTLVAADQVLNGRRYQFASWKPMSGGERTLRIYPDCVTLNRRAEAFP